MPSNSRLRIESLIIRREIPCYEQPLCAMISEMELALPRTAAPTMPRKRETEQKQQGMAGTSTGLNIAPGSDADGWIIPPPVTLADGTRAQLYKDGEALRAAYEVI